ncbi:mortality factor 4 like 2, isoform CRA_d [Rattus norvegicus]|uniref:Mortality factor 4 like 2, isoform CRA_d n=1 Tax=Rattus norvegicus TaxID=10116 RepID=A6KNT5_RAT|nr:mortality factor 4 like 2, isoform CRA_d [Rattus norvegicus]
MCRNILKINKLPSEKVCYILKGEE